MLVFQFDEIHSELEEQKELATNRLTELEKLQKEHQEALKDVERLKMDVSGGKSRNSLAPGKCGCNFKYVIFKHHLVNGIFSVSSTYCQQVNATEPDWW